MAALSLPGAYEIKDLFGLTPSDRLLTVYEVA
jgi:hypothetical protein